MAVGTPVIISVTIGAVLVLSVALVSIVRWVSTKPSTQLPPPRSAALLSPYWANQQRYSTHFGGPVDVYDEERKLTGKGSGVFNPYADYSTSNVSDSSLYRGTKTPDGDRTPNSGASFGHENVGPQSEQHHHTPPLHPNELGEISLNSPNPPRQRPTSLQFVNGSPAVRPTGSFGPNGSTTTVGGGAQQAAATDPQQNALPPSAFSHMHPSAPRPFSTSSRSRHSIAGPPAAIAQPPPSFYQTKQDRRASRMSMLSTYSSSGYTYDPRRSSVTSMIRGPPHKSNMQIVLPAPLAATAASGPGIGFPGNSVGNAHDAEDSAFRRNQRRHSRVDLWTETNNIARSKSPLADLSAAADPSGSRSNRRPSLGSEKSGRSLELANSGQFMHMQPPPPLPAASSRSLLTSSPTPNSSSSALPPMSTAMTTPQLSTERVHEKHPSSSDAHSTSTSNNAAVVDDSKPPAPPPQPQNVVKSDNLPIIPSLPAIEPTKDI